MSKIKCRRRYLREKVFAEYQANIKRASAYLENPVGKYNGFEGWRAKHEAKEDLAFFKKAIFNHYEAEAGREPELPADYADLCNSITKALNYMTAKKLSDKTGINYSHVIQLSTARKPTECMLSQVGKWQKQMRAL